MSRKVGWGLAFLIGIGGARAQAPKPKATLTGHESSIIALEFSPDGKTLASVEQENHGHPVKLWHADDGRSLADLDHKSFYRGVSLAFSPDGKRLAVVDRCGQTVVW